MCLTECLTSQALFGAVGCQTKQGGAMYFQSRKTIRFTGIPIMLWLATAMFALAAASPPVAFSAPAANCFSPPAGLVSWWKGEGDTLDSAGGNDGSAVGSIAF